MSLRSSGLRRTRLRVLAALLCPGCCVFVVPLENRGRREDRVRAAPAVSCATCAFGEERTRAYRFSGEPPAFPAQWCYGLYRALPGEPGFLATVATHALDPIGSMRNPRNLTPASGRQDHTTLPSASRAVRQKRIRVHRSPRPTFVTIAKRPSCGQGMTRDRPVIWPLRKAEYFFDRDWTTQISLI